MGYEQTLNLPKTDFPMRGNLPQREPEILQFWEDKNIYYLVQQLTADKPKFILHDGPPYANGDIHLGTTLNKILKDIIVKFHSLTGYDAPYVPGWDTHGLPIEQQVIKKLGIDRHKLDVQEFRKQCKDYAMKYVGVQREQFKRLGVRGDWNRPYLTLAPEFEAVQIGVFGQMAKKGFIYKGLKPVYWCTDCETALAEAEIDYSDRRSPSFYVKFPVIKANGRFDEEDAYVVIWTTTPWTLPANTAIAVHPDYDYVLVEAGSQRLVMAKHLYQEVLKLMGQEENKVLAEWKGSLLEGIVCQNPLMDRNSVVVLGEHVTLDQGTGCVHTAPGHGVEDFEIGKKYNLPVISPLDNRGRFTHEGKQFQGLFVEDANKAIGKELQEKGMLLYRSFVQHQYPHCWRCKTGVLFRATEQWFASIDGFRQEALKAIKNVRWIPAWGQERIHSMVAERGDWCISRQRTWGVPIPIFYCDACNQVIINDETISRIQNLFRQHGSDIWFSATADELVPPGLKCGCCGHARFRKETDIMDVWFDSGSSHAAVLETHPDLQWPADLYLEGSDQHRGWFNSSLSTSVATRGLPPYHAVLTHGYVVDELGRKMSKSLGNGIDPIDVINEMGADILRLWVASADYRRDVAASPNIMKQMVEAYRKIRNTCRFILGNLSDYDPVQHQVSYQEMEELDRWALMRLHQLIRRVTQAYRDYEFHVVYHAIHNFCVVDMSAIYLDIIKDRLYTMPAWSKARRAAQSTIYETIISLVKMLTPILAFTSEEIWQHLPMNGVRPESVQLAGWPEVKEEYLSVELEQKWDRLMEVRREVARHLERARKEKLIGSSLQAEVHLYALEEPYYVFLKLHEGLLNTIFITSLVQVHWPGSEVPETAGSSEEISGLKVLVQKAQGEKCDRCWMYSPTVGGYVEHPVLCSRCVHAVQSMS